MKAYFRKLDNNWWQAYELDLYINPTTFLPEFIPQFTITLETVEKINHSLREFKPLEDIIRTHGNYCTYKIFFVDQADEAHFLLWSAEGIEV